MILNILVDGSNIPRHYYQGGRKCAEAYYLKEMQRLLRKLERKCSRIRLKIYIDSSLREKIDDREWLIRLIEAKEIHECPRGIPADIYLLTELIKDPVNTIIISNDRFRDYDLKKINHETSWRFPIKYEGENVLIPGLFRRISLQA